MAKQTTDRIVVAPTEQDYFHLQTIADALRCPSNPFPTTSDCVRRALAVLAVAMTVPAVTGYTRKVASARPKMRPSGDHGHNGAVEAVEAV